MNIIDWIKLQYNRIVCSNDKVYMAQISERDKLIEIYKSHESELNKTIQTKNELLKQYAIQVDTLEEEIDNFQKEEQVYPQPDIPVDWDRFPYFPVSKVWYYDGEQKQIVEVDVKFTPSKLTRIWTDEMYNYVTTNFKKVKDKPELEQVVFLRNLVFNKCKYQFDYDSKGLTTENWKMPIVTYYSGVGDCEDLTNLWLTFCNICGIPSNKVFNLTGYYNTTGHSFGGYLGDKMYIIECTARKDPVVFKGSVYKCKGNLNGLSNWQFSGIPTEEQW